MSQQFIDDQAFKGINFTQVRLKIGTYESCQFGNCNFSTLHLSHINFIDCQFSNCDFSNAILTETGLQNSQFTNCKLMGLRFDTCKPFLFAADFQHCRLDFSSFYQMDLKKSKFKDCSLKAVEFASANLRKVEFENCSLLDANFEQTNLTETDFRTAFHFTIEPTENQINKAKFSTNGLIGLLRKYNLTIQI